LFRTAVRWPAPRPDLVPREGQPERCRLRLPGCRPAQMRKHGVRSVTQQCEPPVRPRLQRLAVIEAPPKAALHRREQSHDRCIPSDEGRRKLVAVSDGGPGFGLGVGAGDEMSSASRCFLPGPRDVPPSTCAPLASHRQMNIRVGLHLEMGAWPIVISGGPSLVSASVSDLNR
jgi:hypothetical protein